MFHASRLLLAVKTAFCALCQAHRERERLFSLFRSQRTAFAHYQTCSAGQRSASWAHLTTSDFVLACTGCSRHKVSNQHILEHVWQHWYACCNNIRVRFHKRLCCGKDSVVTFCACVGRCVFFLVLCVMPFLSVSFGHGALVKNQPTVNRLCARDENKKPRTRAPKKKK